MSGVALISTYGNYFILDYVMSGNKAVYLLISGVDCRRAQFGTS